MSTLRVRQLIEAMDSQKRAELKKLLPPNTRLPDFPAAKVPSGIISALPKSNAYSILGMAAEEMLRLPSTEIELDGLLSVLSLYEPALNESKIRASVTTQPFLDCLIETRKKLEKVIRPQDGELKFEEEVVWDSVAGHPDMWNKTQVFEVKCTGELNNPMKKSSLWTSFLFQLFAYGSLKKDATDLYLVLPLQKEVIHYDVRKWTERTAFRDLLTNLSTHTQTEGADNAYNAECLCAEYKIGCHHHKEKSIVETIRKLPWVDRPYQIFLSGPQNSNMNVKDADLAEAYQILQKSQQQVFIHSQYIINLCSTDKDNWATKLLCKNLDAAKAFGSRGVVVHVGKSTTQPLEEAMKKMRASLQEALTHASKECPLLLETPAGQGTELLTGREEFLDFVDSFKDERLRACIDTCHVFAAGHDPLQYIVTALKRPGLVKLIHFNDSLEPCGACKDRHAYVGSGHIGFDTMSQIAELCHTHNLPMVIE